MFFKPSISKNSLLHVYIHIYGDTVPHVIRNLPSCLALYARKYGPFLLREANIEVIQMRWFALILYTEILGQSSCTSNYPGFQTRFFTEIHVDVSNFFNEIRCSLSLQWRAAYAFCRCVHFFLKQKEEYITLVPKWAYFFFNLSHTTLFDHF